MPSNKFANEISNYHDFNIDGKHNMKVNRYKDASLEVVISPGVDTSVGDLLQHFDHVEKSGSSLVYYYETNPFWVCLYIARNLQEYPQPQWVRSDLDAKFEDMKSNDFSATFIPSDAQHAFITYFQSRFEDVDLLAAINERYWEEKSSLQKQVEGRSRRV